MVAVSTLLLKVGPALKFEQPAPSLVQLHFEDLQRWASLDSLFQCLISLITVFLSLPCLCVSTRISISPVTSQVDSKLTP